MESYSEDGLEPDRVLEPGEPALPALPEPDFRQLADELVASAANRQIALIGEGGLLTVLTEQVLQSELEAEMAHHLGCDRGDPMGRNRGNSRNGTTPKTVTTDDVGQVTIEVPRDRDGTFEPQIVAKHQRRLAGVDEAVISLYGKGMTTGDIAEHLDEVYDTTVSRDLISVVTARVAEDMRSWQNPAAGSGLPGSHHRRDRAQGPLRDGREPARLRGDGRVHGRAP